MLNPSIFKVSYGYLVLINFNLIFGVVYEYIHIYLEITFG
jgi:hypothetical protein